jgi:hypothetical protein
MGLAALNCSQGRLNGRCRVDYDDSGNATTLIKAALLMYMIVSERIDYVDKSGKSSQGIIIRMKVSALMV